MKKREKVKQNIIQLVKRSGIPIRPQRIARRLSIPDDMDLRTLLGEMVSEGLLIRRPTLLVNGEVDFIYDISPLP